MSYLKSIQKISPSYYVACFLASLVISLLTNLPIWIIAQLLSIDTPISSLLGVGCDNHQSIIVARTITRNLTSIIILWFCFKYYKQKPLLNWKHVSLQWVGFMFFAYLLLIALNGFGNDPALKEKELIVYKNFYNYYVFGDIAAILFSLCSLYLIIRIVPKEIREKRFLPLLIGAFLFIAGYIFRSNLGFMLFSNFS